jgi:type IV secretory pathway VirB2 component (pilin)
MNAFRLRKSSLFALAIVAVVAVASIASPASATQVAGGAINLQATSNALGDFTNLLTGPFAYVISILVIIGGAIAVMQGGGLDNGTMGKVGVAVVAIGLLIGAGSWYKQNTEGVMPVSDLASYTAATNTVRPLDHQHNVRV